MHLDPTNFEENLAAAEACAGGPPLRVKRRSLRQWIRIPQANGRSCAWNDAPRDGAHLCGFTRLRGRTRIGGQAASVLVKQRFTGERRQP
jgi:hypothetical protein